jgi:L-threonylcarbamoyladenylate synthase
VPDVVTGGGPTVAIRVPAHPVARALLEASGVPIAAPSANRSTELSPTTADHVLRSLNGSIDLILDGGPTAGGIESTVLSLAGGRPTILRPGLITRHQIEAVIGPIERRSVDVSPCDGDQHRKSEIRAAAEPGDPRSTQPFPSPGMLERHYAPRAVLEISRSGKRRIRELLAGELPAADRRIGWLCRSEVEPGLFGGPSLEVVKMPTDVAGYAARIYAELHRLDDLGVSHIVVDELPQTEEWVAVRDRLSRAATPKPEVE